MKAWLGLVMAAVLTATGGTAYAGDAGDATYGVVTSEYDLGDEAVTLPGGVKSELRAKVYGPKDAPGKRPLVVFLHGYHDACYGGDQKQRWPCAPDQRPVPSFRGYDAPGRELAKHGYVVVSISSNAVNRNVSKTLDAATRLRGELVLAHLDLWKHSSRVDLDNVGLMGHSRGGEGVVAAALANAARPHPYGIKAVLPLASTSATRQALPGIALNLITGYCDGDVYDLQGQHLYDDSRYDTSAPKSQVLLMGANHNFFNSEWTPGQAEAPATDDWAFNPDEEPCGTATPTRLTAVQQQALGRVYISGFFRWILGGEEAQGKLFDGSDPNVTSQSPDRLDLARFDQPVSTTGDLTATVCTGSPSWLPDPNPELPFCTENEQPDRFPHWVPSFFLPTVPNPAITALHWTGPGALRIPVNARKQYDVLTFRAAADPDKPSTFTIRLIDDQGHRDVAVSLENLPGKPENAQPKTLLRTVRIPLKTTNLKAVELRTANEGRAFISDLALSTPSRGRTTLNQLPRISVSDAAPVAEGNSATKVNFTVTLNRPSHQQVTVHAETAGFTADPEIVLPLTTTITFVPGETRKTVAVQIRGNTTAQPDQDFKLALAVPRNAITDDAWATGKVLDDDTGPNTQHDKQAPALPPRGGPGYRGM
ncbi:hypothetical protein GCM10029976_051850 [Kribbella albertanoniae]|uniref:Calx-beta domain-containing protein n=1 Tax=Kribbella albertanoniae TaxID=1266829 RepID=A0A4R4PQP0_9ACTN|nr:hypothetical protein [Kribbella albertanoniae]TDC24611.1 hypothetical protein E1261_25740 [Kribbella albertanoniae]